MTDVATIDFETRSACELTDAGAYKYSMHPTTGVLCLAWMMGDGPSVPLWHRGYDFEPQSPDPEELMDHVAEGGMVEAHNVLFEFVIWNHVLRREFPQFPELRLDQLMCSAAKAAQFSLPRSLEQMCRVLGTPHQKDSAGGKVMLKCSKPRKPDKHEKTFVRDTGLQFWELAELYGWNMWHEAEADIRRTWAYCQDDVRAEHSGSSMLRPMRRREVEFWQMDLRMNLRGIACDVPGVTKVIRMADEEKERLNKRISEVTGGAVPKGSSRARLLRWCNEDRGFWHVMNTQADHIEEVLGRYPECPDDVREALRISVDVNKTSTSKYQQMLEQVSDDGRIRDMMLYYGANRTGRWSGKGVQPHNFVRGFSKDMEAAWEVFEHGDRDIVELIYGSPMDAFARGCRGGLIAGPGKELHVADYAAIEARVLLWLAGDEDGLEIFRRGEDIYLAMASDIYEIPLEKLDKKTHPEERQMGKKAVLGLGYQMGEEKFDDECAAEGIDMPRAFYRKVVKAYREKRFPLVASLWPETEEAAVNAIKHQGEVFHARRVKYKVIGPFLHCQLPSGRMLSYFQPTISMSRNVTWRATNKQGKEASIRVRVKLDEPMPAVYNRAKEVARLSEKTIVNPADFEVNDKPQIFYSGQDQKTRQWVRIPTYGGMLTENNTQATARDLLAEAMLRCDRSEKYDLLLSVHDEVVAEADLGAGDVREFEHMMSQNPPWAEGLPVAAEGWKGLRYRK